MSDLIKKIKIKKQDGTFSDYIPIGADAINVKVADGESAETKLNKKPYYYNTVADMKADTKLKAGDMAITLGYYEINDGGAAKYNIISDSGYSNLYYEELNNGLLAALLLVDCINIEQLGAIENTDITNIIINNCNLFKKIILNKDYKITDRININSELIIDGTNHTIYLETNSLVFSNTGYLTIMNVTFNGQNTYFPSSIISNSEELIITNCNFNNFQNLNTTNRKSLILNSKKIIAINNTFNNIICLGNNNIDDDYGILRCLHSVSEIDNVLDIYIENNHFSNINTVDNQGAYTIDDADPIVVQGQIQNKRCIIKNCTFYNSGRRAIKIQSSNVNISDIEAVWDNNYDTQSLLQIQGENININNIKADMGNGSQLLFIFHSKNVNITNIVGESTYNFATTSGSASCITISDSNNINVINGSIKGFSKAINIFGVTAQYINIKNINFIDLYSHILLISSRTQSSSTPIEACTLSNIIIDSCSFNCKGNATDRIMAITVLDSTKDSIDNIKILNSNFKIDKISYTEGTIYVNSSVTNFILDKCIFNVTNTLNSKPMLLFTNTFTILNTVINSIDSAAADLRITNNGYGYIENTFSNTRLRLMDNAKVISNYNQFANIMGTTADNSIINARK